MSDILVAYFSATGTTEKVAQKLAQVVKGDIFQILPQKLYTSEDLDWHDKNSRSSLEEADSASRPAIKNKVDDMDKYKVIFIGFPIWWYKAPRIIETFLEEYNFTGKKLIPFATSGSSPLGNTESILKQVCPDADWLPGIRVPAAVSSAELTNWIRTLNL